jgi:hypothetical protein
MPCPFFLSYARQDAKIGVANPKPDPHFEAFLEKLNQRVIQLTGKPTPGFVDRSVIQPGQDWPDELAEALRTTETMVCLYSPAYFLSEHCGKEMQVLLDRRRIYINAYAGKKPANIIPVLWQPVPWRIPKTLPDIQYKNDKLDLDNMGVWNLGDSGQNAELLAVANQIAIRVRDAADLTPLEPLPQQPRMGAVLNAFLPPPLPLPEFDSPDATAGPDAVTFVYASTARWNAWPWAPPDEHAVLYLAAAVARGKELRRRNNVVILFVDAASLSLAGLDLRLRDYDRPEHSSFATIVMINNNCPPEIRTTLDKVFPYFGRRAAPHFQVIESREVFNAEMREKFSKVIADTLEQLRLAVMNDPYGQNGGGKASQFQSLPIVNGPGPLQAAP